MYPKNRIDALTDGIYAVAMTLLVLDIRLPEDFHPHSDRELVDALLGLWPRLFPYVISFLILGRRWYGSLGDKGEASIVTYAFSRWWMFSMLLVTCFPFTTLVMGRYPGFAPAIWLYAGANLLMGLASYRLSMLMPEIHSHAIQRRRRIVIVALVAASLLAIAWSLWSPQYALLSYLLVFIIPRVFDIADKRRGHPH